MPVSHAPLVFASWKPLSAGCCCALKWIRCRIGEKGVTIKPELQDFSIFYDSTRQYEHVLYAPQDVCNGASRCSVQVAKCSEDTLTKEKEAELDCVLVPTRCHGNFWLIIGSSGASTLQDHIPIRLKSTCGCAQNTKMNSIYSQSVFSKRLRPLAPPSLQSSVSSSPIMSYQNVGLNPPRPLEVLLTIGKGNKLAVHKLKVTMGHLPIDVALLIPASLIPKYNMQRAYPLHTSGSAQMTLGFQFNCNLKVETTSGTEIFVHDMTSLWTQFKSTCWLDQTPLGVEGVDNTVLCPALMQMVYDTAIQDLGRTRDKAE
eukprot:TRINITY_DN112938_c0_g1_i1.p1 TRINITY_DN112938_c0_g1~~TRINITY_DN112938_c0_g1_i1.p1  ORF type:complete len:341 (-),score=-0.76 TRINITY_DN112938_c0_g1_i1:55-999(-)